MNQKLPRCTAMVDEDHWEYSAQDGHETEVVRTWVEHRQCYAIGLYQFQDKQQLCRTHTTVRLIDEAKRAGLLRDLRETGGTITT